MQGLLMEGTQRKHGSRDRKGRQVVEPWLCSGDRTPLQGSRAPGREVPYSSPPHFQDDKPVPTRLPARKLDAPGPKHCPFVHLPPKGMQPKLRPLSHQRAKPQDPVLGAVVEAVWSLP